MQLVENVDFSTPFLSLAEGAECSPRGKLLSVLDCGAALSRNRNSVLLMARFIRFTHGTGAGQIGFHVLGAIARVLHSGKHFVLGRTLNKTAVLAAPTRNLRTVNLKGIPGHRRMKINSRHRNRSR